MTKYREAVKYVGKTFLSGKGQTLEDYIAYIKEPGNKLQLSQKQTFTIEENSKTVVMILFKFWTVTWS